MTTADVITGSDAPPAKATTMASAMSPLRHRVFRGLWLATAASNVGTWMQHVGNAWLMTSLSPSPLYVSLVQAAVSLPTFLLALPAGALADVVDRRRVLLVAQVWMLLAAAGLAALTLLGLVSAPSLLLFAAMIGIGSALAAPAFQSVVPDLVPREDLGGAVALNSVAVSIARAVGPAVGGLVIAAAGAAAASGLNALSFLGVVVVLYRWHPTPAPPMLPAERFAAAVRTGARYVLHAGPLRAVLARTAAFMLGASGLWALVPVVARDELRLGPAGFGLLLGCLGGGAFAGVMLLPRARMRIPADVLVVLGTVLFAAAELSLAHVRRPIVLAPLLFAGGVGWVAVLSTLNVAAHRAVPGWVRSRALAAHLLAWSGTVTLGSILWGALAARAGVGVALTASAAALLLGTFSAVRFRLAPGEALDLSPGRHWPAPRVAVEPEPDRGPVMVEIVYRVRTESASAFTLAMRPLREERLRGGAISWGLFVDAADPERYVETFVVESWLEHLRQHERVTVTDRAAQDALLPFLVAGSAPAVSHLIGALAGAAGSHNRGRGT